MDYSESVAYLYSLGHEVLSAKFRLDTIGTLLDELGRPQLTFKSLIVAGTNGKGSTAAMIESAARGGGHRTGLYTSPHLVRIEERISVCGQQIEPEAFAHHATQVRDAAERLVTAGRLSAVPSFFEQVTASAFLHFREKAVEIAILEVGLGGRLDATNIVAPIVSVITSIDFDHQDVLGSDIAQIAAEKAAVIKSGSRAVIARQPHIAASEVLMRRCLEVNVLPVFTGEPEIINATGDGRLILNYESATSKYTGILLGLRGRHQAENAAAAIEAAELLSETGFPISREAIVKGIRFVTWPGRLELTDHSPPLLLDGAHNPAAARRLRQYLDEFSPQPVTLMFGAMADKDIAGMTCELFNRARTIVLTRVRDPRAATGATMGKAALGTASNVIFTESPKQALSWARSVTPATGLILVTGSLHLVGEVKRLLEEEDQQTAFVGGRNC
ncbi:MAG TPA: folylpolyglutamate synthase/dihydrofolate synthase family protein [Chthoniobacterales bacterium]|jgi:dihydrofolate synthase/folylpolyglutamate synthase